MGNVVEFPERKPEDLWVGDFSVFRRPDGTHFAMLADLSGRECDTAETPRERGIRLSDALADAATNNKAAMRLIG